MTSTTAVFITAPVTAVLAAFVATTLAAVSVAAESRVWTIGVATKDTMSASSHGRVC